MLRTGSVASLCVVCGPTSASLVTTKNEYRIVRCGTCGVLYVDGCTALTGLEEFYGSAYFSGRENAVCGYRDYVGERRLHLRNAKVLLSFVERRFKGPDRRLLDVGCAHGFLLDAARARGWEVCGVDISAEAVRYARQQLGLSVFLGRVDQCDLPPESFDVICMIGTVEHLADPMKALRSVARLLKRNGLLLITTLDIEGRLGYFSWKPPEHLFYFSARSLSRLLGAAGFTVELRRTQWRYFSVADLTTRLWGFFSLPRAARCVGVLEGLGVGRAWVKIPTNEMVVLARPKQRKPPEAGS